MVIVSVDPRGQPLPEFADEGVTGGNTPLRKHGAKPGPIEGESLDPLQSANGRWSKSERAEVRLLKGPLQHRSEQRLAVLAAGDVKVKTTRSSLRLELTNRLHGALRRLLEIELEHTDAISRSGVLIDQESNQLGLNTVVVIDQRHEVHVLGETSSRSEDELSERRSSLEGNRGPQFGMRKYAFQQDGQNNLLPSDGHINAVLACVAPDCCFRDQRIPASA